MARTHSPSEYYIYLVCVNLFMYSSHIMNDNDVALFIVQICDLSSVKIIEMLRN